jgi:diguanylate cyclase (GGDEF)-like protein
MTYLLASLALLVIAALDYLSGVELMMSPFYAIPCLLMDWRIGRVAALMYGLGASYVQWLVGTFGGHPYSNELYFYWDLILNLLFYGALIWIVAKLRFALEMERVLSRGDFLTRVANRKLLHEIVDSEIQRCRRHGHVLTLISVDCDNFKAFNEKYGHSVGDLLLQAVADTLKRTFRGSDRIARSGDDEFTVVLPEMPPEHAVAVLGKLRAQLATLTLLRGWPVTFSIAGSVFVKPDATLDEVMGRHGKVMAQAKAEGRDREVHRIWNDGVAEPA